MKAQSGYNIVEMAIALVVLGLLVGGALVPLQARYEIEERREVEDLLLKSQEAIVAYAVRNRTQDRKMIYFDGQSYYLPGNRPYLPCPDTTGNGLENRKGLPALNVTVPAATMTVAGVCEQQKGILPWKTLGVEELDPWGRHLTYRVDIAFSSALLGFDQLTRADVFDVRLSTTLAGTQRRYDYRNSPHDIGAVVCRAIRNTTADAPGCPANGTDFAGIEAGVVSTATLTLGARVIPAHTGGTVVSDYGVVDGIPFVVLSHGKNGYGAVPRIVTAISTTVTTVGPLNCISPPADFSDNNEEEAANSFYGADHPLKNCFTPGSALTRDNMSESWFAQTPESEGEGSDDIVSWTSSNQLLGHMLEGGVLPVPLLDFLQE